MCTDTPRFSAMLLYMACSPYSISAANRRSGGTLHAREFLYVGAYSTLNINVDFTRLFNCINCIKMFGSRLDLSGPPEESTRWKGRKED